jgi:hypothetical protein
MHTPWMAATTGFGQVSARRIRSSRLGDAMARGLPNSLMSAPPLKALPPPVMTTARTAASAIARSRPSATARRVSRPRPLTGGLSRVMTATPSCTW